VDEQLFYLSVNPY